MSGDNIVADTSLVIHFFKGNRIAQEALRGKSVWISCITEMEVLSFAGLTENEIRLIRAFFSECIIVEMGSDIKETAIAVRVKYGTKLPDSVIAATAIYLCFPLLTMDKGFNRISELDCILLNA